MWQYSVTIEFEPALTMSTTCKGNLYGEKSSNMNDQPANISALFNGGGVVTTKNSCKQSSCITEDKNGWTDKIGKNVYIKATTTASDQPGGVDSGAIQKTQMSEKQHGASNLIVNVEHNSDTLDVDSDHPLKTR